MTGTEEILITVEKRENVGKGHARRIRRNDRVPAVVYGGDNPPYPITADEKVVRDLIRKHGDNTIFLLKLADSKDERTAMIKHLDVHPITGRLEHIDFIRVTRGHALHVNVDVELKGDAIGVRHGGRVDFVTRSLPVEVMPRDMFSKIEIDISDLDLGQHIEVGQLVDKLPPSAKFLVDAHRVVVVLEAPHAAAESEDTGAAGLLTSEKVEPEVIRRGKDAAE